MRRVVRVARRTDGVVEARRIATTLGARVRARRRELRMRQVDLGGRVGLAQSRISDVERGLGVGLPLDIWVALGIALSMPLAVSFSRPTRAEDALADAGHLEIQEYLLEIGRRHGRSGALEQQTRAYNPTHSIDVLHLDDNHDCAIVEEAWNRFGDLGAAARSSMRNVADLETRASAGRVALCWVVRDSHANRRSFVATPRPSPHASRAHRSHGSRLSKRAPPRPSSPASSGTTPRDAASSRFG
jgi:transcriptional regulator with XRE-family HTH domain